MSTLQNNASVEYFKKAFNSLKIGMGILLNNGSYLFVNDEFCSLLGYNRNEVIGKDLNFAISANKTNKIKIAAILDTENSVYSINHQLIHKSGNLIWVNLKYNAIKSEKGLVDFILVLLEDITLQKNTELDLIFSEEKNRALSEATQEAVFFSDKGICIECNSAASKLFGYSYQEFMGMFASNIIASKSKDLVLNNLFSDYKEPYEAVAQKKDGTEFWAEFHGKTFPYKGKQIRVTSIRDISNRKKLEAEQKASEYSYRLLFENMNEAFVLFKTVVNESEKSLDFIYLDVNPVFEKLTGLKKSVILNRRISEIMPHQREFLFEKFGSLGNNIQSTHFINYDGELKKYFDTHAYSPEKEYLAVAFTDITEKIESEKEIAMHNRRLECLVRLSQASVSNYIELLKKTIKEAVLILNGSCGAFYFYNTIDDKFEFINCVLDVNEPQIEESIMTELFHNVFELKKSKILNEEELLNYSKKHISTLKSMLLIPVNSKGIVSIVFGVGSKDSEFTEFEKKHLNLFIDSVLQIIEKQKYQDQILGDKLKAEINESRFFEIQKAGKIGWYEALLKEGLFLGSYETYNIFFDEYFDYPVSSQQLLEALHPDDRDTFFSTVRANIELKSAEFDWEYRVITPKKGVKHVFSRAFLKFDNEGNLIRRYGIVQDITEKKKTELELVRHNERLESLFRVAQFTDTSTTELLKKALFEALQLTSSNMGFIFRFNKEQELFILETFTEDKLDKEKIIAFRDIANKTKKKFLSDILHLGEPYIDNNLLDNKQLLTEVLGENTNFNNLMLVPISIGKIESLWIAVINESHHFNDIDIRQLTLLMHSVWKIVERQNYQEELIKAKEKAEESDNLKSAFLANMSHEIRTPMNGIIGFSDLFIQEDISFDKRQSYAKIVIESGKQLLTILDDILDISKIEVGQIVISKELVNVNDVITSLFSFYSPKAKDSNINLFPYKDLIDEQSVIFTDKQRLIQVLNNLLSNAFKFTTFGEISFGYLLKDATLEFYVRDTGSGIPINMHSVVFERFRQAEQSKVRNFRGTGLGLSISQKLVELLGGKIWLESELGKGSTFYFILPFETINAKGEIKAIELFNKQTKQFTVLVAEDEEINLLYVNEVLSNAGFKTLHAKNGLEAVELCKRHAEIDLVLMDIKMPEMDGLKATEEIRKFRRDLIIIAVTAFAMEKDKEQAFLAGCTDYISKPLNKNLLLEMVNKNIKIQ